MRSIIHPDTDHPRVDFPALYNAAADLLALNQAWPQKVAYVQADTGQTLSYGDLEQQARRWAQVLLADEIGRAHV